MAHENDMKLKASASKAVLGHCPVCLFSCSDGVPEDLQQGLCHPQSPEYLLQKLCVHPVHVAHVLPFSRDQSSWKSSALSTCRWFLTLFNLWLFHFQFSSVQLLSRVRLFATPWIAAHQASLSPTPRVYSYSRPSSRWCHPAISSSIVPFSSCPQPLPASESFPMSQLFAWGGQSTGVSALASFLQWTPRADLL